MRELLYDLRDSWRGLRRDRLYALAVVLTLALTLGASIGVFSIVNGVLLRPLDYPDSASLVSLREVVPRMVDRYPTLPVAMRHFEVWRDRARSFTSMAATDWRTSTLTGAGDAAQLVVLRASGTLFDVLQLPVAVGRGLTREDEDLGRPAVTVISDALWRERFGANPSVVGRSITLNGAAFTVVGVLPRGAVLPRLNPLTESGRMTTEFAAIVPFRISIAKFDWMGSFNYGVIARLRPGVSLQQAQAEMEVLQGSVAEIAGRETKSAGGAGLRAWMMPLGEAIAGPVRRGLLLLFGAISALLLIACANLANLTLTRTLGRLREAAVRGALGASRWRLVRGVIVDQLILSVAGASLGLALASAALRAFLRTAAIDLPRVHSIAVDARVVGFAVAVALLAALAIGIVPAWRLARRDLESILRSGGRSSDRGAQRVRSALLTAQIALSVVLLAVGGLFVSSLARLLRVDAGFTAHGALTVEIAPGSAKYPDTPERAALYDRILERVREAPGVTAAAWTSALPLTGETWIDAVREPGRPVAPDAQLSANYRFIGPDYFRAVGIPILRGRSIEPQDRAAAPTPAVINARAARALWPAADALGREFTPADPTQRFRVVGIVGEGRVTTLEADAPLMVYVPYWFNNEGKSLLVVRTEGDPLALAPAIRSLVRDVDPDVAVAKVAPLQQVVDSALQTRRQQTTLFAGFGAAALVIALVGVYATTAHGVSRRRRELNIRVALGARMSQVFSMVLRQSVTPVVIGLAAGAAAALAAGGAVASLLYEVRPRDPFVVCAVLAVVATVALVSAAVATLSGLKIEPAMALRED